MTLARCVERGAIMARLPSLAFKRYSAVVHATLLCATLATVPGVAWADFAGEVTHVHDGDTLTVLVDRAQVRVRLADIDAPELGQAFGKRSKQSLAKLCAGKRAEVDDRGTDRYGRTIGNVTCAGLVANAEQVRAGMAWVFVRYAAPNSPLYGLQDDARRGRAGLWADPSSIQPWEWRRQKTKRK